MAQEAGRELERVLEASRLATSELNYIKDKKEALAVQVTPDFFILFTFARQHNPRSLVSCRPG